MNAKYDQFSFIHAYAGDYAVTTLVKLTTVSYSGYYKWRNRKGERDQDRRDEELLPYILKIFKDHRATYGRKRIKIALEETYELKINEKRISRIMRKYGLQCKIRRKKYKHRPQPHGDVPNILKRNFRAIKPGVKLAVDITYVPVKKGSQKWVYVCAIEDLFNREIIAYSTGTSQDLELVYRALFELKKRGFAKSAVLHSDQGTQFTNPSYMKRLKDMGITQSMSRRGNCWDNACIENFFGHMKSEMPHFHEPETVLEVQEAVDHFIHYYNHNRAQNKLKMSPVKYRKSVA